GVRIQTRTGVNTGEVVAGTGNQTMATGDAVNTAARLEQHAQPGEILLGEPTYRLVRHGVVAEAADPIEAKGKAEPLAAYRLVRALELPFDAGRRLDSPLIGRDNELILAEQAFERAVREQSCSLFTIFGPAGVGKSRLTQEVIRAVEGRATVSRGRCLPYGRGITFWPLIEIVHGLAGITDGDSADQARRALKKLVQEEENADLIVERVVQLLGLSEEQVRAQETFWAVRKLFESLARRAPLVVVFDDIHWAEAALLDMIEHIVDSSRGVSLVLMCIARPELLEHRQGWGGGKMNASSILLEPLREDESAQLMTNLLGGMRLPDEVQHRISEAAEGNPLFVEEMVSMLIDDKVIIVENGSWGFSGDVGSVAVPPTIQALLAARLDRLDPDERAFIQVASVVGKEFGADEAAAIAPESVNVRAADLILSLLRKELVRPDHEATSTDGYRFRHILIRDAAYNGISKQERADLHLRFADWLEAAYPERLSEYEEIIGYHLEQSFSYRSSLGPLDGAARAIGERGGLHLVSAGRRAVARDDSRAAANLFERSLTLIPEGSPERLIAMAGYAQQLYESGEIEDGMKAMLETAEVAHAAGDEQTEWRMKVIHATAEFTHLPSLSIERTHELATQAIRVFERAADKEGLAYAWNLVAWTHNAIGEHHPMLAAALKANDYARESGSDAMRHKVRPMVGSAMYWGPMPSSQAIEWFKRDIETIRSPVQRTIARSGLGMFLALAGQVDEGRQRVHQTIRLHEELGQRILALSMRGFGLGNIETTAENWAEAARQIRTAAFGLRSLGDKGAFSTLAGELSIVLYGLGEFDEAYGLTEQSDEAAAQDDLASQFMWRAGRALVLAAWGRGDEAVALAEEAVRIADGTDGLMWQAEAHMARAEVYRLVGRTQEAAADLRHCIALFEQKEAPLHAARARRKLAELTS
ncbi:MAG: ATP-binding protein, partial [Actinomycetota bacterium]